MTRIQQLILLFVTTTLFIGNVTSADGVILNSGETPHNFAVRIHYDSNELRLKILSTYEPLEADRDKPYIVVEADDAEHEKIRNLGLETSIDSHFTELLNSPMPLYEQSVEGLIASRTSVAGYGCYRTVEETFQAARDIVTNYPNLATWTDFGNTWEKENGFGGFDMMVLKLTSNATGGSKPKVFITSSIHAREYAPAELTTRFAEQLVNNYGSDADITWILDHHEVHLMLMANPDGRKHAEAGLLWRKNTNQAYCGVDSINRGVDLNRNFDFLWGCCDGSRGEGCSFEFRGPEPASEPETQAIQDYLKAHFQDRRGPAPEDAAAADTQGIYLDIHSFGELILWPWGHTFDAAPNGEALQTLGRKLAWFNNHLPQQSIGLYPTDGTTIDYAYGTLGLPAYTYELGTDFFQDCETFENRIVPDNMPSLINVLKSARAPYSLPAGPETLDLTLARENDERLMLRATADDTRFNNSNGEEPSQAIVAASYYINTPPWEAGATPFPMTASDGGFNGSVEAIEAEIDTSGLSGSRHIVYVEATDAAGNTGVVSAVFLEAASMFDASQAAIFFDDFESDLGWSFDPYGSDTATTGNWERGNPEATDIGGPKQLDTTPSGSHALVTGAAAGIDADSNDIDDGFTSVLSPEIAIPPGGSFSLSFMYYLSHDSNASSADLLRVSIIGSTGQELLAELGAPSNRDAAWSSFTTSIDAYAGQNVRLLIEAADGDSGNIVEAAIDDMRIDGTAGPGNHVPEIEDPGDQTSFEGDVISLQVVATDIDNDTLFYAAGGLPDGLSIDSSTGLISGTLSDTSSGVFLTTLYVNDGTAGNNTSLIWFVQEPAPPAQTDIIHVSSSTSGVVDGIAFQDEDILAYDTGTESWSLFIDGSDIGLGGNADHDIDAFTLLADGSMLMSFSGDTSLAGIGAIDDSDLVRFIPVSTGTDTQGSFELYFDGSDVGLQNSSEDIDSVHQLDNGDLLIGTRGAISVPGVSGSDEDLIRFTPASLGANTSGTWSLYFDGSDVDLGGNNSEDIWGAWVDSSSGDIHITTRDSFSVTGLTGGMEDIFICSPGSLGATTTCSYSTYWDGAAAGIAGERLDALHIQR